MLMVRPGLGTAIDTPRLSLSSLFTFDAQRSNHRDLTMIDARRHGDADVQYRTTNATTLGLMALYDRTETPGEINIGTGILTDRRQAQRWEVSPNFAHRFGPHTSITGSYDFMAESLWSTTAPDACRSSASGLSQIVYRAFDGDRRGSWRGISPIRRDATNGSDSVAVLGGWDHQFSPALAVLDPGGTARLLLPRTAAGSDAASRCATHRGSKSASTTRTAKRSCSASADRSPITAAARASRCRSAARSRSAATPPQPRSTRSTRIASRPIARRSSRRGHPAASIRFNASYGVDLPAGQHPAQRLHRCRRLAACLWRKCHRGAAIQPFHQGAGRSGRTRERGIRNDESSSSSSSLGCVRRVTRARAGGAACNAVSGGRDRDNGGAARPQRPQRQAPAVEAATAPAPHRAGSRSPSAPRHASHRSSAAPTRSTWRRNT